MSTIVFSIIEFIGKPVSAKIGEKKSDVADPSVPDTIHVDLLPCSISRGNNAQQSEAWPIFKHLARYLTCGVISNPKVNNIGRPSINF